MRQIFARHLLAIIGFVLLSVASAKASSVFVDLALDTDSLSDNSRAVIKTLGEGELTPEEAGNGGR